MFLDFEKAFDSVSHEFIVAMLLATGLPPNFVQFIMMSFKETSAKIIVNGYLTKSFDLPGGGRQGDPLFPLIFCIVMMGLGVLLDEDPQYEGLEGPFGISFKQIQYMDDATMTIASANDLNRIIENLKIFCTASGMVINMEKTAGLFLGTWRTERPPHLSDEIDWVTDTTALKILGIQMGNDIKRDATITITVKNMQDYVTTRSSAHLTLQGRILIANACIASKAIFPLTHSSHTHKDILKMKSLLNIYTNGNGASHSYIPYDTRTAPRSHGGPPITLLNIERMAHTIAASQIHNITTTLNPTMDMKLLAEQILLWGKEKKLYHLAHIMPLM